MLNTYMHKMCINKSPCSNFSLSICFCTDNLGVVMSIARSCFTHSIKLKDGYGR